MRALSQVFRQAGPLRPAALMTSGRVAVVILNYNGKELAERCVRSVLASAYAATEVILVDNASSDDSVEYLHRLFPGLLILECRENLDRKSTRLNSSHIPLSRMP